MRTFLLALYQCAPLIYPVNRMQLFDTRDCWNVPGMEEQAAVDAVFLPVRQRIKTIGLHRRLIKLSH